MYFSSGTSKDSEPSVPGVEHHDMLEKLGCMEDDPHNLGCRRTKGVWPATGPTAVRQSLAFQMGRKDEHPCVVPHSKAHLTAYANGYPAPLFEASGSQHHRGVGCEYTFKDRLEEAFRGLDRSKGPGWSQIYGCSTKGEFLELPDKAEICVASLLLYLVYDPTWLSTLNSLQLYRLGLMDPEGLKVKKEVHLRSKADMKRWRLIFLGSARLEVIHRILHGPQNVLEMTLYQSGFTHHSSCSAFGSCVGMGHDDANTELLVAAMRRIGLQNGGQCQDASSFDMLLSASTLYCDGWRRALLALQGGALSPYADAQLVASIVMSRHIFHIGMDLYATGQLGTLGSGLFSTAATNSYFRGMLYSAAYWDGFPDNAKKIVQSLLMGDDLAGTRKARSDHYEKWADLGLLLNKIDEDEIIPISSENGMSMEDDGRGGQHLVDERAVVYYTSHRYDFKTSIATYMNLDKIMYVCIFEHIHVCMYVCM